MAEKGKRMDLSWDFPHASRRMPVFADNVVATSHPLAAQAGLGIMAAGGNAVDGALAAAIALTVVEPTSNGVGSDAFALVWDGAAPRGINGSGRSPGGWTPDRFAGRACVPAHGWDPVRDRGHRISVETPFWGYGGAQLILRLDGGYYCAASDPRKDGQAVGF